MARETVVLAIRRIEARLVDALMGERLRGLPNLGSRDAPFYGQRIVPSRAAGAHLPPDGREVMAIGTDGKLVVVWAFRGKVESRGVLDQELVLEDLENYVKIVAELLERFIALSDRRRQRMKLAENLAHQLLAVVDGITIDK